MKRSSTSKGTTLQAVLYTRVIGESSVDAKLDDLRELQLQTCERKAADMQATVVGWYDDYEPDDGIRKGLWRLLERVVGDRDIDVVIVERRHTLDQTRAGQMELRELIPGPSWWLPNLQCSPSR